MSLHARVNGRRMYPVWHGVRKAGGGWGTVNRRLCGGLLTTPKSVPLHYVY